MGLAALLLLLIYIVMRREWLAALVTWLIFYTLLLLFFTSSWPFVFLYTIQAAAVVITVSRLGLLATMFYWVFLMLWFEFPLTLDFSRWYAGNGLFAVSVMLALSGYGYYTSLGGQKAFAGKLLDQ